MRLTNQQIEEYNERGYLLVPSVFSEQELDVMRNELPTVLADDSPRRVVEKNQRAVRSVYGSHEINDVFKRLAAHPRIVTPSEQILESRVYVYQFKINVKASFEGDVWPWHQDFIYWLKEDGMAAPRIVNASVFLDEVTEFNGPLYFVPGSHKLGVIDVRPRQLPTPGGVERRAPYKDAPPWIANLISDLKYTVDRQTLAGISRSHGLVAPKGPAGSVLYFHPNLVHGSANNMSPFDRGIAFVTYNSVENPLPPSQNPRPEFLASRRPTALEPVSDDALLPARL